MAPELLFIFHQIFSALSLASLDLIQCTLRNIFARQISPKRHDRGQRIAEMDEDATSEDNMDAQSSPSSRLPADLGQLHSVPLKVLAQSIEFLRLSS